MGSRSSNWCGADVSRVDVLSGACRFCGSVPQSLGLKGCAYCGRGPSHYPNGRALPDWRTIGLTAPRPSGVPDVGYVEYRMEWRDQFGVLRSDVWPKP
jgi:hypothetical protein